MPNNRDDFSKETIIRLASRVGYICSCPGCNASTVGPSMESSSKVSNIGVAAHICAAAPGGKRYDSNMTSDERKSIDNGIWLCQSHSKLIDTDEVKYTKKLLHKWKEEAENRADLALSNTEYIDNYYRNNGENLTILQNILDNLLFEGNYQELGLILNSNKNKFSEKYDEFILRYKIIYDIFCDIARIKTDITDYISLPNKSGVSILIETLCPFAMNADLKQLIPFCCDEEILEIANLVISTGVSLDLLKKINDIKIIKNKDRNLNLAYKTSSYIVFVMGIFSAKDKDGKPLSLYNKEFYYKCISKCFDFMRDVVNNKKISYNDISFIVDNSSRINYLDMFHKEKIYSCILQRLVYNERLFKKLYCCIDEKTMHSKLIKSVVYKFEILNGKTMDINELEEFSDVTGDYLPLLMYLDIIDIQEANLFLDEHQYLYKKNVSFLQIKKKTAPGEIEKLIKKYGDFYKDNFTFNCLWLSYFEDEDKLEWLKQKQELIGVDNILIYIEILEKYKKYEDLYLLSEMLIVDKPLFDIACILFQNEFNTEKTERLLQKLVGNNFSEKYLYYMLGVTQRKLGKVENAKENFKLEYDMFKTERALYALLETRFSTKQISDDIYLKAAAVSQNAILQNIVGVTYLELHDNVKAQIGFLRSLLIDDNIEQSWCGLGNTLLGKKEKDSVDIIRKNTVCVLKNHRYEVKIAIHSPSVLEGIVPNNLANCCHYSQEDPIVSSLMFSSVGDTVDFKEENFEVTNIASIDDFFAPIAIGKLLDDPSTTKIEGDISDSLIQITKIMKDICEREENVIDQYNNLEMKFPLTALSRSIGKNCLLTMQFLLFGNKDKIRNNINEFKGELGCTTFVLSYDSIITIVQLGIDYDKIRKLNVVCPIYVRDLLIRDVDEEIALLNDEKRGNFLTYNNGQVSLARHSIESKKTELKFLTRVKAFVNRLKVVENKDYIFRNNQLSNFLSKHELYSENACLYAVDMDENNCLVSDDQFLFGIASLEHHKTIGLTGLLEILDLTFDEVLTGITCLAELNYSIYLTTGLYIKLENKIDTAEKYKSFVSFLFSDNNDNPASDYHREIVMDLFRNLCAYDENFINKKTPLHQVIPCHFAELYPEQIRAIVQDIKNNLRIDITEGTDK